MSGEGSSTSATNSENDEPLLLSMFKSMNERQERLESQLSLLIQSKEIPTNQALPEDTLSIQADNEFDNENDSSQEEENSTSESSGRKRYHEEQENDLRSILNEPKNQRLDANTNNIEEVQNISMEDILDEFSPPSNEEIGPDVGDKLAKKAIEYWKSELKSTKSLFDKYKIPENCKEMANISKINTVLFRKISNNFLKRRDGSLIDLQKCLSKISAMNLQLADQALKAQRAAELSKAPCSTTIDMHNFLETCLDSFALIGHVHKKLNLHRKKLLSSGLNSNIRDICNQETPQESEELFGNDLSSSLKEAQQVNRMIEPNNRGYPTHKPRGGRPSRGRPYHRGGRGNFNNQGFRKQKRSENYQHY